VRINSKTRRKLAENFPEFGMPGLTDHIVLPFAKKCQTDISQMTPGSSNHGPADKR
jgi:hypothetical protein